VHLFAFELGTLKFINEPLKLLGWICAVEQQPPVAIK
jgi:hypothetical protein